MTVNKLSAQIPLLSLSLLRKGISSSLIVSLLQELRLRWVGFTVRVCPCGEEDRTMDVTLGYDLNTCRLWLSSDQSSLRQAPLPAGNFSTHVTPSLTSPPPSVSHILPLNINFLSISWSLSKIPSFDLSLGSCAMCYSFTLPCHAFPQCLLSHHLTRSSCSFYLPCCRLA